MESPRRAWVSCAFVASLAAIVYIRILTYTFVFDDKVLIVNNVFLRQAWSPIRAFAHHAWYGTPYSALYYRPIVAASLALNGRLLGWGPVGFHLVNMILHAVNAALLLVLARRLGQSVGAATLAAAFFALHPAAAWSVASIVARVDLLPVLFVLLAWISYASPRPGRRSAGLTGLFFLCALLCKESAAAFLAVPILGLRPPADRPAGVPEGRVAEAAFEAPSRRRWLPVASTAAAFLAYLAMRFAADVPLLIDPALIDRATNPLARLPLAERLGAAFRLSGRYLAYLLVPDRLTDGADYVSGPASQRSLASPGALFGALLLIVWCLGALGLWIRRKRIAVPLAFAPLSFLPASNLLLPIGSLYAQNFLYLPLVGLGLSLGDLLSRILPAHDSLAGARVRGEIAAWVGAPLLALLAACTWHESAIWRDEEALFLNWVERFPSYAFAHTGLGLALMAEGDPAAAVAPLRRALELNPRNPEANDNLSAALTLSVKDGPPPERRETLEEALRHTRDALALDPNLVQAHVNASKVLILLARSEEAEREAREALRLSPGLAPARLNLAESLFRQSRYKEAAEEFKAMAALFPSDAEIRSPYVVSLIHVGDLVEARRAAEEARRAFPDYAWFDFCLARVEARAGHKEAALALLRRALGKDPRMSDWMTKVDDFKGYPGPSELGDVRDGGQ